MDGEAISLNGTLCTITDPASPMFAIPGTCADIASGEGLIAPDDGGGNVITDEFPPPPLLLLPLPLLL